MNTVHDLTADDLAATRPYSMIVEWSDEDDAYIVTVAELPGCRTHGATRAEAVAMGEEAIAGWLAVARARRIAAGAPTVRRAAH